MDEAVSSTQHEQPGLESDPSSAISGLPGNVNLELLQQATSYLNSGISGSGSDAGSAVNEDPGFHEHVNSLRDTMFYVCQGSCLCGTVNNRGKVIYCYGDLVPRHGELFAEGAQGADGGTSSKDLLAAQLGVWTFGIFALLLVLILIRSSIRSMKSHLEKMSNRLPYHFDDDEMSNHSATSPQINDSKTMDTMDPPDLFSDDGTLTPDALKDGEEGTDESPLHLGNAKKYGQTGIPTDRLKKIRINRKDLKKGGDGLRGKNVMDQYRVKDKDMKRTMK